MPLESHPFAVAAARASECATSLGSFQPYHHLLFAEQDSIGKKSWSAFAKDAGVSNIARFNKCVADTTRIAWIAQDLRAAASLGVDATPTFLINGLEVTGWPGEERLDAYVDSAMTSAEWSCWLH